MPRIFEKKSMGELLVDETNKLKYVLVLIDCRAQIGTNRPLRGHLRQIGSRGTK